MQGPELYIKIGRRYYKVGREFTGWPADGVWLVTRDGKSSYVYAKLGEVPDPLRLASVERHREAICRVLHDMRAAKMMAMREQHWVGASVDEIATAIVRAIMEVRE